MTANGNSPARNAGNVLHLPQDYSLLDQFLRWCLLLVAFSQPFRGVLPSLYGIHSFAYWITGLALLPAVVRSPHILRVFFSSKPMVLLFVVHNWSVILYFLNPLHSNLYLITRTYNLWTLTMLFLYIAHDIKWRKRLIWFYWFGWVLFLGYSYLDFFSDGLNICPSCRYLGGRLIAGFTYNTHGAEVALGIILSLALITQLRLFIAKAILIFFIALGGFALLFSASRGAVLALLLTVFAWYLVSMTVASQRQQNLRFFVGFMVSMAIILVLVMSALEPAALLVERFSYRIDKTIQNQYFSGRDVILTDSLQLASDNILGVGQSNAMILLGEPQLGYSGRTGAHNDYMKTLIEAGWLGFLVFVVALLAIVKRGWRWLLTSNSPHYFWPLIFLLLVTAVGQGLYLQTTWLFLALNAITPRDSSGENLANSSAIDR